MNNVIYTPKGRAFEYSPLALNLYTGCNHGCIYCYSPRALRKTRIEFQQAVRPKESILERLEKDCKKMEGDPRQILLCFSCDPYQPEGKDVLVRTYKNRFDATKIGRILIDPLSKSKKILGVQNITREALLILEKYHMNVTVLTKGGTRARRDFDILARNGWSFGTSINHFFDYGMAEFEPQPCANPLDRIDAIHIAHDMGIKTWVSLEPVIYPESALSVVRKLLDIVDHWKIGLLNYMPEVFDRINWGKFLREVEHLLQGKNYYIKQDLEKYRRT